ncbi:ATP-binding cassette domain-containing protein [Rhodopila sp.]|uniref:ATP-binding cassette domain-containing protein n=1 Tax=Rhodopila sp. TaxID=2480087 RepID=UPI003D0DD96D
MLEVDIIRKQSAGRIVLRDVAFSIRRGEVVALLGPSGAGKTTLLRLLLGLDDGYEGRVRRDWRSVGVVFQEPRLLPWLTVAENIRLVVPDGAKPPDIDGLLDSVRLGGAGALRPGQLSVGMARRVALARALAVAPDLLVLDEPFASLDARLGAALADWLAGWARDTGAAVIAATHDLAQVMRAASRLLILDGVPATLHADVTVPDGGDAALHARLVGQFGFLTGMQTTTGEQT